MKNLATALLLFAAMHASGQPSHAPALAASRTSILLAWSEIDAASGRARIHVALLDLDARQISPVRTLPAANEAADATEPVLATNGTSFFLTWIEMNIAHVIPIDAGGRPAGPPRRVLGFVPTPLTSSLAWNGTAWLLSRGDIESVFAADGTLISSTPVPPGEVSAANGIVTRARFLKTPVFGGGCHPLPCVTGYVVDLDWTSGEQSGRHRLSEPPLSRPSIAGNVIAWSVPAGIAYFVLGETTVHTIPASLDFAHPPSIACDTKQCLVAYATIFADVYGAVLDAAGTIPIATTARMESAPRVESLGSGRFLVAWLSDLAGDERLAWQIVTTRASRRRAVR